MELMTTVPSWILSFQSATCSSLQVYLESNSQSGVSSSALVPNLVKADIGGIQREFQLDKDAILALNVDGKIQSVLSLAMEPQLPLSDGTYPITLNLFADLEASQQVSSGSIPAATLSGCQQEENGGSQNSTVSAPTQTMTVTNIQSASATPATDVSLETAKSLSEGSLLDNTDSSNKKLIHSGISIGVLGFVLLIVITLLVIRCRRKRKQVSKEYLTSQNWSEDA